MMASELQRRRRAALHAALASAESEAPHPLVEWLHRVKTVRTQDSLLAWCAEWQDVSAGLARDVDGSVETFLKIGRDLIAAVYFGITVVALFAEPAEGARIQEAVQNSGERALEHLASARRTATYNSRVSWSEVSSFRAAWGMQTAQWPASG